MEYTKNSALEDEVVQLIYQNAGLYKIKPLFTESLRPECTSLLYLQQSLGSKELDALNTYTNGAARIAYE